MADPAHDATPDPVAYLENVLDLLRGGARDPAGLHLDQELCGGLYEGLGDVLDGVEVLLALAGEVQAAVAPAPRRRTPVERKLIAQMAALLDDEGRVLMFPDIYRAPADEGGGGMNEDLPPRLTVRAIAAIVCEDYGIPLSLLISQKRTQHIVEPRQVAMWLAHRHSGSSLPMIGRALGDRDHSTVLHGSRVVEDRRERDTVFAARLRRLVDDLSAAELGLRKRAEPEPPAQQSDAPAPPPQRAAEPLVVQLGPSQAESTVLKALDRYLTARDELIASTHTRAELGARRHADDAYGALRRAYLAMKDARRKAGASA